MLMRNSDTKLLDTILDKMVETVDQSKGQIFSIAEQSRVDYEALLKELQQIKSQIHSSIVEQEELERKVKMARKRLSEVSRDFSVHSEEVVRKAYEQAHDLQVKLLVMRQNEKQLIDRRNELDRRLLSVHTTIERAEQLISQTAVVLNYLTQDMKAFGRALEDAQSKQAFGLQVMEAQEEERKRLSREIHDGPAQMMANVLMRSDIIEKLYRERGVEAAFKEIRDLKKMVRSALYEVRRIIYDLRPMALDDLGLIPTLKKYLATVSEYSRSQNAVPNITFSNIGLEKRLPSNMEVALFRLIQESVQNALKHANATEIQVKLEIKKEQVLAVVKDNGKGFDVNKKKSGSFGIMGMKERIDLLDGDITIRSKPDEGTVVLISVPIIEQPLT
ncbi:sensor histidine kinase [Domibacillus sp. DTU_2020_1001157_1_SI_ALB_TIR_016]|uniref:sensor histidine kinase n=1 Tax=Domibacillus sp. DTU_2020_1001157_1_SI_ALB_TIR_016 TaxID=3077789 RepID=UPI0028E87403|nr:sensor histidine kinase [Domibacillus sp. DTU_2020_1001157_1_SI_ALB_TIR_016]WNS81276.1 sensor histidine kinase [Domibacillus sp. DTU_2020_1001157_1_SI_ALB_TIR_016]